MKRYGTVLVFKEGTTRKSAETALILLTDILDGGLPHVEEYDDDEGGPVWYIP